MSATSKKLTADAKALDEVAAAADYLAGLIEGDEDAQAANHADADTMRRWAELCRVVAAASA